MLYIPKDYQKIGIDFLSARDEAILFAGIGLGKTGMGLETAHIKITNLESKGFLIVSPLAVTNHQWPKEIQKFKQFDKHLSFANLRTKEGQRDFMLGRKAIYLINYESLPRFCEDMLRGKRYKQWPIDSVIFDELSVAKNHKSRRIVAARPFIEALERRYGMTGTLMPNGYHDLYGQVGLIDNRKTFGKFIGKFRKEHFESQQIYLPSGKTQNKYCVTDEGKFKIDKKLSELVVTLKSSDYLDIPDTENIDVFVKMPKEARKHYDELEEDLMTLLSGGDSKLDLNDVSDEELEEFAEDFEECDSIVAANALGLIVKLSQVSSGYAYYGKDRSVAVLHNEKLKALRKIVDNDPTNFLVICQFTHEMQAIVEAFPDAELFSTDKIDRWNQRKIRILVCHPLSMKYGLNMQYGGEAVAWFSFKYSSEQKMQAEGRILRTGQDEFTRVYQIVGADTVDEAMIEAVRGKMDGQDALADTLSNLLKMRSAA